MNEDSSKNDSRIAAAVQLELERRARSRRIIWWLLGGTLAVAVLISVYGARERDVLQLEVTGDAQFTSAVATAIGTEPDLIDVLAANDSMRRVVAEEAENVVTRDEFANSLIRSEPLQQQIESASTAAVASLTSTTAFRSAIQDVVGVLPNSVQSDLERNQREIEALRSRMSELGGAQSYIQRLEAVEKAIERQMPISGVQEPSTDVTELQAMIVELRAHVETNDAMIRTLETAAGQPRDGNSARSYLLRERSINALSDTALSVTLGAETGGRIDSIQVVDQNGEVVYQSTGDIELGEGFEFTNSDGRRYRGTLSYSQSRVWARDYVGMELEELAH